MMTVILEVKLIIIYILRKNYKDKQILLWKNVHQSIILQ